MKNVRFVVAAIAALVSAGSAAQAATVVGGNLLSTADANFIGSSIAPGEITYTLVYDYKAGDTSANFHAAADAYNGTVTVVRGGANNAYLFGGYNPLNWAGLGYKDANSAFVFSLDKQTKLISGGASGSYNPYEIYAWSQYWPTFGGGHDLHLGAGNSQQSYSNLGFSYNAPGGYGTTQAQTYLAGSYGFTWTELEVYSVSVTSAVPEPATWAMMLIGFGGIGATMRRRKTTARIQFA